MGVHGILFFLFEIFFIFKLSDDTIISSNKPISLTKEIVCSIKGLSLKIFIFLFFTPLEFALAGIIANTFFFHLIIFFKPDSNKVFGT